MKEFEELPIDWLVVSIKEIAAARANAIVGGPFGSDLVSKDYVRVGVPVIRGQNMAQHYVSGDFAFVSEEKAKNLQANTARAGDVIFTQRGTLGQVSLVPSGTYEEFVVSQSQMKLSLNSQIASAEYIYQYFIGPIGQRQIADSAIQTGVPHTNLEILKNYQVPVPPTLREQQAIAEALSDADALIESISLLLAKKRQIKQGAMQELLTGKKRLPGFKGQWTRFEIGDIASPSTEVNAHREALPVLACSKHFGFVDSLGFFKNQVFSRDTASYKVVRRGQIGYPANHIEEGSIGLQDLYNAALVSPIYVVFSAASSIDSYFLHRLLKLDQYRQTFLSATSTSVDRRGSLRWPEFSKINVVLPSYEEQRAIRQVLQEVEAETEALKATLDKARLVKQGMMQELLTGRIRLVQPASNVIPLPTKSAATKPPFTQPTHNWQINEAVVIGVLAQRFGSDQFPLPRKRRVKLTYLLHRHAEGRAEGFLKKAAGPYDPKIKYKGPEQIALKNGYVRVLRNGKYEGFVAGDMAEAARRYFEQWYGMAALDWLERFRYRRTDELELLATVDMAMVDLAAAGEPADGAGVKRIIAAHPDWVPKLSRALFSDDNVRRAVEECRALFP